MAGAGCAFVSIGYEGRRVAGRVIAGAGEHRLPRRERVDGGKGLVVSGLTCWVEDGHCSWLG